MRFTATLALVVAAVAPVALAQSVNIDPVTLTQCATSTITFEGSTGPYYVAVIPANDPCTEDALAEFYDVEGNSVDYYVNQAAGTTVQVYVLDVNGVETWGEIETVGDGDGSCLPGASVSTTDSATSTSSIETTSSSSTPSTTSIVPTTHIASAQVASYTPDSYSGTSNDSNDGTDDTPANAASDNTNGASSLTASLTAVFGVVAAVAALL